MKNKLMFLVIGVLFVVMIGYATPSEVCSEFKNELDCNNQKTDKGCSWSAGECIFQCVNLSIENCESDFGCMVTEISGEKSCTKNT